MKLTTTGIQKSKRTKLVYEYGAVRVQYKVSKSRLPEDEKQGISYISALSSSEIRALINDNVIQLEMFSKDLVEIEDGEIRYVLCNNPVLQKEKDQTREYLKSRFEQEISGRKNFRWEICHRKHCYKGGHGHKAGTGKI